MFIFYSFPKPNTISTCPASKRILPICSKSEFSSVYVAIHILTMTTKIIHFKFCLFIQEKNILFLPLYYQLSILYKIHLLVVLISFNLKVFLLNYMNSTSHTLSKSPSSLPASSLWRLVFILNLQQLLKYLRYLCNRTYSMTNKCKKSFMSTISNTILLFLKNNFYQTLSKFFSYYLFNKPYYRNPYKNV